MAARDRYSVSVKCAKCGETGVIHYSENDYPFMNSLDQEVDKIEGRFAARNIDKNRVEITCSACGTVVSSR